MKRSLLAMGLALCPIWAFAQVGPVENWTSADAFASRSDGDLHASAMDPERSPTAVASPDWVNVLGLDFRGYTSTFRVGTWTDGALVCMAGSTNSFASARMHLPHKRKITHFRVWGYDNNVSEDSGNMEVSLWESCLPDIASATAPTSKQLAFLLSAGAPGAFTVATVLDPAPEVDAHRCTYWAVAGFPECLSPLDLQVRKVHVEHTK